MLMLLVKYQYRNMLHLKSIQKKKGFTLIEMLVAISLFSLVLLVVLGAMLTIINVNRKAQALASVINNFNSSIESMNRVIKSAKPGSIDLISSTELELTVDNENGLVGPSSLFGTDVVVNFQYDSANNAIVRTLNGGAELPITSSDVDIQKLAFAGNSGTSTDQPQIIIVVAGEAGINEDSKTSFEIMTSVTQRQSNAGSGS